MPQENSNIKERNRLRIKEPGKYNVTMHNDDFTPMDFVTLILKIIFFKEESDAQNLMLKIHYEGQAIVGTYNYDIAMTKSSEATNMARKNGFPLRITVNPT